MRPVTTLIATLLLATPSLAETAWVTDEFEITLRTGPSNANRIVRMLASGTRLETLEASDDGEYVRVRTDGGVEGWVLSRYLISQPAARERLRGASERLRSLQGEHEQLRAQLGELRGQAEQIDTSNAQLESANRRLTAELEQIREASANVLALREESERLRSQVAGQGARIAALQDENERLRDSSQREWFVAGAGVLLGGIVLGMILPRLRWRRRSSWGEL